MSDSVRVTLDPNYMPTDYKKRVELIYQLKQLYLAVSRARQQVIIISQSNAFQIYANDQSIIERPTERSRAEWEERAHYYFERGEFEAAAECFGKSGRVDWQSFSWGLHLLSIREIDQAESILLEKDSLSDSILATETYKSAVLELKFNREEQLKGRARNLLDNGKYLEAAEIFGSVELDQWQTLCQSLHAISNGEMKLANSLAGQLTDEAVIASPYYHRLIMRIQKEEKSASKKHTDKISSSNVDHRVASRQTSLQNSVPRMIKVKPPTPQWSKLIRAAKNHDETVLRNIEGLYYSHMNPLMTASMLGDREDIAALLPFYDINAQNPNGGTALMQAAVEGNMEAVEYLIKSGADLETETLDGNTALLRASHYGQHNIVRYLINQGANIDHTNNNDYSANNIALENYNNISSFSRSVDNNPYMIILSLLNEHSQNDYLVKDFNDYTNILTQCTLAIQPFIMHHRYITFEEIMSDAEHEEVSPLTIPSYFRKLLYAKDKGYVKTTLTGVVACLLNNIHYHYALMCLSDVMTKYHRYDLAISLITYALNITKAGNNPFSAVKYPYSYIQEYSYQLAKLWSNLGLYDKARELIHSAASYGDTGYIGYRDDGHASWDEALRYLSQQ